MQSISPAAQHASFARLVPKVSQINRFPAFWPSALVPESCGEPLRLRAWDGLEGRLSTKTAAGMDIVSLATEHALLALWIPIVRPGGQRREFANLRAWAMNVGEAVTATETTAYVYAIGKASMHAQSACGIHKVRCRGFDCERALHRWDRLRAFWTGNASVRMVTTKSALRVVSVRPAAEPPLCALWVPKVWDVRMCRKFAAARRTRDAEEITATTETTLQIFPVSITTKVVGLAIWIPVVSDTDWHRVKFAFAYLCTVLAKHSTEQDANDGHRKQTHVNP